MHLRWHAWTAVLAATILTMAPAVVRDAAAAAASPPTIVAQPVSEIAKRFGTVTLSVDATGTPPLKYQWSRNGTAWPGWDKSRLQLDGFSENDVGVYVVTVTNAAGSVTSVPVTVNLPGGPPAAAPAVPAAPSPPAPPVVSPAAPAVTPPVTIPAAPAVAPQPLPPAESTADVGQKVTLEVLADGTPPFTYQWKKDGATMDGATKSTFVIPNIQKTDAGAFTCTVTNSAGSAVSSSFQLIVASPH